MNESLEMSLELYLGSEEEAEAIEKSLSPDNVRLPQGVEIRLERKGRVVRIAVMGPLERLLTVKNTIEDIIISLYPVLKETFRE